MSKFLKRLFWVLLAFVLVFFSVENRHTVPLNLPAVQLTIDMPLYFIFFIGLVVGIALSTVAVGWSRLQSFVARRKAEREAQHLKTRLKVQDQEDSVVKAEESYTAVADAAKE